MPTRTPKVSPQVKGEQAPSQPSASTSSIPSGTTTTVIKVVDGDTIEITGGKKLRYIGIDTPETVDPRRPVMCFGKQASDENKRLVLGKTIIMVKDVSETDKYGRLLRYVYLPDGTFVNELLVKEGYARATSYPPDISFQDLFRQAEEQAREAQRGLWGSCSLTPTPALQSFHSAGEAATPLPVIATNASADKDCKDFATHAQAQTYFESKGGSKTNNVDNLDGDHDGVACETLP
jgi:endonuclease YncB( thermonuclease family)